MKKVYRITPELETIPTDEILNSYMEKYRIHLIREDMGGNKGIHISNDDR